MARHRQARIQKTQPDQIEQLVGGLACGRIVSDAAQDHVTQRERLLERIRGAVEEFVDGDGLFVLRFIERRRGIGSPLRRGIGGPLRRGRRGHGIRRDRVCGVPRPGGDGGHGGQRLGTAIAFDEFGADMAEAAERVRWRDLDARTQRVQSAAQSVTRDSVGVQPLSLHADIELDDQTRDVLDGPQDLGYDRLLVEARGAEQRTLRAQHVVDRVSIQRLGGQLLHSGVERPGDGLDLATHEIPELLIAGRVRRRRAVHGRRRRGRHGDRAPPVDNGVGAGVHAILVVAAPGQRTQVRDGITRTVDRLGTPFERTGDDVPKNVLERPGRSHDVGMACQFGGAAQFPGASSPGPPVPSP
jgi:hypothetical protein